MKTSEDFNGENVREVWDFRLSTAHPLLRNDIGDTWKVQIWANDNPDYDPEKPDVLAEPLEVYDTEIPIDKNDHHDTGKVAECFAWLHSVRDKYSRDHIELRKPVVALINAANDKANLINVEIQNARAAEDLPLFDQKTGELKRHLDTANAEIKVATRKMQDAINDIKFGGAE